MMLALGVLLSAAAHAAPKKLERVDGSSGVDDVDSLYFTISPDDRWILFAKEEGDRHSVRLVLVDLVTGSKYRFVGGESGFRHLRLREDCWTPDSRFCLWHHEGTADMHRYSTPPSFLLDVGGTKPTHTVRPVRGAPIWEGPLPSRLMCSDCTEPDGEFIVANLPRSYRYRSPQSEGDARLSRDRRRIFCQEDLGRGVALQEFDVRSRSVRRLKNFRSLFKTYAHYFGTGGIQELRESPDGRFLAFRLGVELKVLDLERNKVRTVKRHVFGSLHWTADSSHLFFYAHAKGNDPKRERYLYSIRTEDLW